MAEGVNKTGGEPQQQQPEEIFDLIDKLENIVDQMQVVPLQYITAERVRQFIRIKLAAKRQIFSFELAAKCQIQVLQHVGPKAFDYFSCQNSAPVNWEKLELNYSS